MGAVALMGAWRTWRAWRNSRQRPGRVRFYIQLGMQLLLGLACLTFGFWFLLYGG